MQTLKYSGEEGIELGRMTEHKRSPCSVEQSSLTSLASKRHKADLSAKERKEKLGERIVALQQLVSPYGKTDTASVLLEAMEYIQFLHEQVKVLSAPYLQSTPSIVQSLALLELLEAMVQISGPPSRPLLPDLRKLFRNSIETLLRNQRP